MSRVSTPPSRSEVEAGRRAAKEAYWNKPISDAYWIGYVAERVVVRWLWYMGIKVEWLNSEGDAGGAGDFRGPAGLVDQKTLRTRNADAIREVHVQGYQHAKLRDVDSLLFVGYENPGEQGERVVILGSISVIAFFVAARFIEPGAIWHGREVVRGGVYVLPVEKLRCPDAAFKT